MDLDHKLFSSRHQEAIILEALNRVQRMAESSSGEGRVRSVSFDLGASINLNTGAPTGGQEDECAIELGKVVSDTAAPPEAHENASNQKEHQL